jgi:membrane-associated phospholipid phosphatase
MLYFPFVDAGLAAVIHSDARVAWQMVAMDAEVMAFAGFVGVATDHFVGRARPSEPRCRRDPHYERFCNQPDEFSSFLSGHSVIAAAGAGLTCAHHLNIPLYGGGAGDIAACVTAATLALATGIGRIVNDRHWATDVSLGLLIGGVAGYGWPTWFHYRIRNLASDGDVHVTVLPVIAPGTVSGTVMGTF